MPEKDDIGKNCCRAGRAYDEELITVKRKGDRIED